LAMMAYVSKRKLTRSRYPREAGFHAAIAKATRTTTERKIPGNVKAINVTEL